MAPRFGSKAKYLVRWLVLARAVVYATSARDVKRTARSCFGCIVCSLKTENPNELKKTKRANKRSNGPLKCVCVCLERISGVYLKRARDIVPQSKDDDLSLCKLFILAFMFLMYPFLTF